MRSRSPVFTFRGPRAGFTLIEVLMGSFLTVVIMTMLFSVLTGALRAWEGGTSQMEANSDARLAMEYLARDLENMVVRRTDYDQEWLVSKPSDDEHLGVKSSWLTFFAPSLSRAPDQDGEINAISYQVEYQDPISSGDEFRIFGLYRHMIDPANTFAYALGISKDAGENLLTDFWEAQSLDESLSETDDNPSGTRDPATRSSLLIPNVVRFEVAWLIRDHASGDLYRFGNDAEIRLSNELYVNGSPYDATLEAADISLTLLSREGMNRYRVMKGSQGADLIRQHGRVHTIRVPIHY